MAIRTADDLQRGRRHAPADRILNGKKLSLIIAQRCLHLPHRTRDGGSSQNVRWTAQAAIGEAADLESRRPYADVPRIKYRCPTNLVDLLADEWSRLSPRRGVLLADQLTMTLPSLSEPFESTFDLSVRVDEEERPVTPRSRVVCTGAARQLAHPVSDF